MLHIHTSMSFLPERKKTCKYQSTFLHFNDNLKILYIHVLFYSIKLHIEPLSTYVINLRLE